MVQTFQPMIALHRVCSAGFPLLLAAAHASAATSGSFTYVDNGGNITITRCSNVAGAVSVPDSIDGKPVVQIADGAFGFRSAITGVTIPNSVVSIGNDAFSYCSGLSSIIIPESVTTLGTGVFRSCSSLQSVSLPSGLAAVPNAAFIYCSALESISLPAATKSIGSYSFYYCPNLLTATLPQGLASIGSQAFATCGKLNSIEIPDSVSSIGRYAFVSCHGLTAIHLPQGLKELEQGILSDCPGLTEVEVPSAVERIGVECFGGCLKLRKVVLPQSLKRVDGAFGNCPSLRTVHFPAGLKKLSIWAFGHSAVEKAYFAGPAPEFLDGDTFYEVPETFQTYFVDGKKGFTWPTWGGFPTTPLGPEIMLSDSDDIPITTRVSTQHFGARVKGYKRGKTFTIRNIGTKTLKGLSTAVLDSPDGDFTCTAPIRTSLAPGQSTVFRVLFQPTDDGRRHAVLKIRSNDANENPVTIKLSGLGMK